MCGLAVEELLQEAGYDSGEFQNVFSHHDDLEFIMGHKYVQGVSFTGSTPGGKIIASIAGKNIKRSVLELGGCDPFIVLKDADLELASDLAISGRLANAGQVCFASKRFIIDETVYESFKEKLISKCEKMKIGDPFDADTKIGPLARGDLLEHIQQQVDKAVADGGELLYGGNRLEDEQMKNGNYISPAVIEVDEENSLTREETFGPVFTLIKSKGEEDSIRIANSSDYGLGGVVVTKDQQKGEKVAKRLESGMVFVNENTKSDSRLPSGGMKLSGFGRECGDYGVKEFSNIKTLWIK